MVRKYSWILVLVLLASCCEPRIVSINPNEVQQESSVQMVLTANKCTFFEDLGVDSIVFTPSGGIEVHGITVEDNTTLSFMINVAVDAIIGDYSVIVVYDDGNQVIVGANVLTVTPAP